MRRGSAEAPPADNAEPLRLQAAEHTLLRYNLPGYKDILSRELLLLHLQYKENY